MAMRESDVMAPKGASVQDFNAINQQRHCFIPESKDPVIMAVTCAPVVDMLVADFKRDDEGSFFVQFPEKAREPASFEKHGTGTRQGRRRQRGSEWDVYVSLFVPCAVPEARYSTGEGCGMRLLIRSRFVPMLITMFPSRHEW
jgi:hypothetical protein